jgi:putative acetyltransferase
MRERGIKAMRADASPNAEAFYCRRGYERCGVRTVNGAQPIRKRLSVDRPQPAAEPISGQAQAED